MSDIVCSIDTPRQEAFTITNLGPCELDAFSPQVAIQTEYTLLSTEVEHDRILLERAGPRAKVFFDGKKSVAAIVTCGGLCPGLNNVIRALTLCLKFRYHVPTVLGCMYGYQGLTPNGLPPMELTVENVKTIHQLGGTILGTSRGPQDPDVMIEWLLKYNVNLLFTVGGDGTQRGAHQVAQRCIERGLKIAVVGVPKTIDNDISYIDRTFGFDTAVARAQNALDAAHSEAKAFEGGVGIVKLMGRESGFIALHAALANGDVNLVLLPEVKFSLDAVTRFVASRLGNRGHCVIAVAEGAGEDIWSRECGHDASGNKKLKDVGPALVEHLHKALPLVGIKEHSIKYIDPSYSIRSAPAEPTDALLCISYAHAAVHAAMAGKTDMIVSRLHGDVVHIPISQAVCRRKLVDPHGMLYQTLLDATGMPPSLE